jgi:hypothetical protein
MKYVFHPAALTEYGEDVSYAKNEVVRFSRKVAI